MRIVGGIASFVGVLLAGSVHAAAPAPTVLQPVTMTVALDRAATAESIPGVREAVDRAFNLMAQGKQAVAVGMFDRVIEAADSRLAGDSRPRLCTGTANATRAETSHSVMVDSAVCDAHFGKGFALIDLGRGDLAEAELYKATMMAPGEAHYANEYAELFKSRREWQKSYDLFARAWGIANKDVKGPDAGVAARALRGMGYNMIELGNLDAAEKLFRQSLDYDSRSDSAKGELSYIARKKAIGS